MKGSVWPKCRLVLSKDDGNGSRFRSRQRLSYITALKKFKPRFTSHFT